jgi:hypothetical protein
LGGIRSGLFEFWLRFGSVIPTSRDSFAKASPKPKNLRSEWLQYFFKRSNGFQITMNSTRTPGCNRVGRKFYRRERKKSSKRPSTKHGRMRWVFEVWLFSGCWRLVLFKSLSIRGQKIFAASAFFAVKICVSNFEFLISDLKFVSIRVHSWLKPPSALFRAGFILAVKRGFPYVARSLLRG